MNRLVACMQCTDDRVRCHDHPPSLARLSFVIRAEKASSNMVSRRKSLNCFVACLNRKECWRGTGDNYRNKKLSLAHFLCERECRSATSFLLYYSMLLVCDHRRYAPWPPIIRSVARLVPYCSSSVEVKPTSTIKVKRSCWN